MLHPAVVIVISGLMVKFFIFCSLMSFLIQEKLNIRGGGEDQPFRDPTTATETVCEETKSLKETNSETFYWSVSNLNKCPGGSHLSFASPRSCCCCCFYCPSRSKFWTPSGLAVCHSFKIQCVHSHVWYFPRINSPRRAPQVRSFLDFCLSYYQRLAPPPLAFSKEQYLGEKNYKW